MANISIKEAPRDGANWTPALFAQSPLAEVFDGLDGRDELVIPGSARSYDIPMVQLRQLGELGFDARDVADAFEVRKDRVVHSAHDGFFDHDSTVVRTVKQEPNAYVYPRTEALEGRPLRSPDRVWSRASNLLLVSRLRLNTQKVTSIYLDVPVIGNTWWTFYTELSERQKKGLNLWLNSTLGVLSYFGKRAITEGAWVQMKKPAWSTMRVLDVTRISDSALDLLETTFEELQTDALEPIAQLDHDSTRIRIDHAVETALNVPSLAPIREFLVREPSFSNHPIR